MNKLSLLLLAASAALLAGCGDDRPVGGTPPSSGYSAPAPAPVASAPAEQTPDPLLPGSGAVPADDPLLPHGTPAQADPLVGSDPLKGRSMPTDHSHWLRGRVQDARLTVLLNGVREGTYTGVVDRDITMKLRAGINTVSFVYAPRRPGSSAQMDLLESEHHPPIPPLASFQSVPLPGDTTDFKPTTRSATFFAK